MSKKLFALISSLVVLSMLFTACAPAATEAPAQEPTAPAEEAAPAEPTEAPAEEEPAAGEPEAGEPAADEWGNLVFAPGAQVKIGLSSALTAGYAAYGQDMLNGVTLAAEEFGDLQGWEVVVEAGDDGCEGAPGVTVAEKFATDPALLGVIGPMCSGTVVAAEPIYGDANIIMITPSSTAVLVTQMGYESVFRTVANDELQAAVTVDFLSQDLGITSLAIAHDQSVYGEGIAQAVKDKFEAGGGTVTAFEGITRGDVDFSGVIGVLRAGEPQAVYFGGMDAEGALLITQLRTAQFEGVFMGPDGIKSVPSYIQASGGAAEGSYATFGAVGGATGYEAFEAAFTEKYGAPVAYGPGSYDSARILLQAAAAVAYVDADGNLVIGKKALADQIRATPFEGVTGHLEFTETGDLGAVSITVFQAQGDDFVPVKTVDFGK
jgi:branched-chain amino acid transport system substrate-binding protein